MTAVKEESIWPVYRRLLGYVKEHWWVFLISMAGYALYSLMQPLMADFVKFIESTLENPAPREVLILCLAPAGFVVVQGHDHWVWPPGEVGYRRTVGGLDIETLSVEPAVFHVPHFLSAAECDEVVRLTRDRMSPATVQPPP